MNTEKQGSKRIPLGLNLGIWDRMTTWDQALDIARLAHSVSIVGALSECRSRIDQLLSEGADRLFVTLPAPTRAECEPILSGIIPTRYQ